MGYANLRKMFTDDRVHTCAAIVSKHDGEELHYFVNDEGDLVVSCRTMQHDVPVHANLGALLGTAGRGVWYIPDENTEVMLAFDNGNFEGEAYIIASYSSGTSPNGLVPGKVFVLGIEVQIRSPNGVASKLPTFEDLQNLRDYVSNQFSANNGHVHVVSGAATTTMTTVTSAASAPTNPPASPVGTIILKAE